MAVCKKIFVNASAALFNSNQSRRLPLPQLSVYCQLFEIRMLFFLAVAQGVDAVVHGQSCYTIELIELWFIWMTDGDTMDYHVYHPHCCPVHRGHVYPLPTVCLFRIAPLKEDFDSYIAVVIFYSSSTFQPVLMTVDGFHCRQYTPCQLFFFY